MLPISWRLFSNTSFSFSNRSKTEYTHNGRRGGQHKPPSEKERAQIHPPFRDFSLVSVKTNQSCSKHVQGNVSKRSSFSFSVTAHIAEFTRRTHASSKCQTSIGPPPKAEISNDQHFQILEGEGRLFLLLSFSATKRTIGNEPMSASAAYRSFSRSSRSRLRCRSALSSIRCLSRNFPDITFSSCLKSHILAIGRFAGKSGNNRTLCYRLANLTALSAAPAPAFSPWTSPPYLPTDFYIHVPQQSKGPCNKKRSFRT